MARILVSNLADADMARMLDGLTREGGQAVAARYTAAIEDLYDRVGDYPDICQARPSLGANVRVGILRPYLVIHRYAEGSNTLAIVRILHGSRNITRQPLKGG